ncbi:uncharacterized protein F5891DRAFT_968999 [Suillus fuscotomentosus]|uniref:N-acetyltransferase domain-containing protein n=1 Tax=Suillus fuscotomentosus TaxID=1912939 RepID=A0AAD4DNH9_9AGAM|nr:uncharacterized protein F5891DRAFT_968999 [Suillus fuscotomentosus]KAG1885931.1 hypothetical protein F5891DRAFT_968999 [Suillus fuscotomentosus]
MPKSTPVTPPTRGLVLPSPTSPSKASFSYKMTVGSEVSDDTLKLCADLFSSNYGIWGDQAATISKFTKKVKMTGARLRSQCLSHLESSVLVTCYIQVGPLESEHPQLYGHTFSTVWDYGENKVGWVTQLVVDAAVRQRYIATHLLQTLKCHSLFSHVNIVGLVLSHPAACNALVKYASANIKDIELDFIRQHAKGILASSPITYLQAAQLSGSLFQDSSTSDAISSVFTEFYVDHTEPLTVLEQYKKKGQWCLGELLGGHEFLAVFPIAPVSPVHNY